MESAIDTSELVNVTKELQVLRNPKGDLIFMMEGQVLFCINSHANAIFPRDIIAMAQTQITNKIMRSK
jgi:hypothetical protein